MSAVELGFITYLATQENPEEQPEGKDALTTQVERANKLEAARNAPLVRLRASGQGGGTGKQTQILKLAKKGLPSAFTRKNKSAREQVIKRQSI